MELKIPFDDEDDESLEPKRSAVNEEEEPTCLLVSIAFSSLSKPAPK